MSLNSVERVQEYLHMPQEPPAILPGSRPPAGVSSQTVLSPYVAIYSLCNRALTNDRRLFFLSLCISGHMTELSRLRI